MYFGRLFNFESWEKLRMINSTIHTVLETSALEVLKWIHHLNYSSVNFFYTFYKPGSYVNLNLPVMDSKLWNNVKYISVPSKSKKSAWLRNVDPVPPVKSCNVSLSTPVGTDWFPYNWKSLVKKNEGVKIMLKFYELCFIIYK